MKQDSDVVFLGLDGPTFGNLPYFLGLRTCFFLGGTGEPQSIWIFAKDRGFMGSSSLDLWCCSSFVGCNFAERFLLSAWLRVASRFGGLLVGFRHSEAWHAEVVLYQNDEADIMTPGRWAPAHLERSSMGDALRLLQVWFPRPFRRTVAKQRPLALPRGQAKEQFCSLKSSQPLKSRCGNESKITPPGNGPHVLVFGSIYQGNPFWCYRILDPHSHLIFLHDAAKIFAAEEPPGPAHRLRGGLRKAGAMAEIDDRAIGAVHGAGWGGRPSWGCLSPLGGEASHPVP